MKEKIMENIAGKLGVPHIAELLADRLSGSELNSLLLEVFDRRTRNISPALLLQQYQVNRFVHPSTTDMISLLDWELQILRLLAGHAFRPVELSPAAQWGSCSVLGPVDQKKIISATRNTEIMADATNSLALYIAGIRRSGGTAASHPSDQTSAGQPLRFCTVHRHVRAQELKEKIHTAHFKIGCMVTGGRDSGSFGFESTHLLEHFKALDQLFRDVFGISRIRFKLQRREGYKEGALLMERVMDHLKKNIRTEIIFEDPPVTNNYYKGIQYKMIIVVGDHEIEIADGGFVDWTQKLLEDNKERLLISGFGLEIMYRLLPEMV
jgi:hypothetical protein